ncbi:hypothetical protein [Salipiger mucosus]|uniref:Pyruvate dehydrogenase (E2 component) SucB n=1 Tax=Salipiger mucosus DSM 16094 TaxID=1123237 RepID=S9QAT3_9RHOB|nr:hypothetical protein [Salipiger mucosus]EPX76748.1 pyruvate dehydrogenase (E2 component) SucB [Salipiger mucosus DSM 16094]
MTADTVKIGTPKDQAHYPLTVARVFVRDGDVVSSGDPLAELRTASDRSVNMRSPVDGLVQGVMTYPGAVVEKRTAILFLSPSPAQEDGEEETPKEAQAEATERTEAASEQDGDPEQKDTASTPDARALMGPSSPKAYPVTVLRTLVRNGDTVRKGDLLAKLELSDGRQVGMRARFDAIVHGVMCTDGFVMQARQPFIYVSEIEAVDAKAAEEPSAREASSQSSQAAEAPPKEDPVQKPEPGPQTSEKTAPKEDVKPRKAPEPEKPAAQRPQPAQETVSPASSEPVTEPARETAKKSGSSRHAPPRSRPQSEKTVRTSDPDSEALWGLSGAVLAAIVIATGTTWFAGHFKMVGSPLATVALVTAAAWALTLYISYRIYRKSELMPVVVAAAFMFLVSGTFVNVVMTPFEVMSPQLAAMISGRDRSPEVSRTSRAEVDEEVAWPQDRLRPLDIFRTGPTPRPSRQQSADFKDWVEG